MNRQQAYEKVNELYMNYIGNNEDTMLDYHCGYQAHRYDLDYEKAFFKDLKDNGFTINGPFHKYNIGNNCKYDIVLKNEDEDGFIIEKKVAEYVHNTGVYGGAFIGLFEWTKDGAIRKHYMSNIR